MAFTQVFKANATGAVKGITDLNKAVNQTEKEFKATTKEANLLRGAARRISEQADPQRRYNRQMQQLAGFVRDGKVQLTDAELVARKYGDRLDRAGKSGSRAFGSSAVSQIRNYAAGVFAVSRAIALIKTGFQEAEKAAQTAADNVFSSIGDQGELQQLTADPKKLGEVNDFAKDLIRRGVISPGNRGQAFKIAFGLQSAGFSAEERESLARVGEEDFVKAEGLLSLGGQVRKVQRLFGGEEEAGTFSEVLDKLVATASEAQASLSQVAGAIPEFGSEARAIGVKLDEALGGFAAVEAGAPNVPAAAVRFKNVLGRFDVDDITVNRDLTDTLDAIAARVAAGEKESTIVPEKRGLAGLRSLLQGRDILEDIERKSRDSAGLFESRAGGLAVIDPVFAAGQLKKKTAGALAAQRENVFAERELVADAVINRVTLEMEDSFGRLGTAIAKILTVFDFVGLDDLLIKQFSNAGNQPLFDDPSKQAVIEDYLRRTAEATENASDRQPVVTGARQE